MKNAVRSSIDGWWGFCIYFEACRHRTATAAKHAIKETILEYGAGLLVRLTPSHLHRPSHNNTRSKDLSMWLRSRHVSSGIRRE